MKKYKVEIKQEYFYCIDVEARDEVEAQEIAIKKWNIISDVYK